MLSVLQEVEQQYKEGSVKHAVVQALKAVRPEALTVQGAFLLDLTCKEELKPARLIHHSGDSSVGMAACPQITARRRMAAHCTSRCGAFFLRAVLDFCDFVCRHHGQGQGAWP
jgi:hypothetical protein